MKELQALADAGGEKENAALGSRPELPPTLDWIWSAFAELNNSRQYVMGSPQAISLSELIRYGELKGYSREEIEELLGFIRRLDNVLLEDTAAKMKAEAKKANKGSGRTRGSRRWTPRRKRQ